MESARTPSRPLGFFWAGSFSVLVHAAVFAGLACWPEPESEDRGDGGPPSIGFVTLAERGGSRGDPFLAGGGKGDTTSPSEKESARLEARWAQDLADGIRSSKPPTTPPSETQPTEAKGNQGRNPGASAGPLPGTGNGPGIGPGGPTTRFFGIPTHGRRILYLLDASSSMGLHGAWIPACREVIASLRLLPPDAEFQIWTYNRQVRALIPGRPGWSRPDEGMVNEVDKALASLQPEGKTDHLPALRRVLAQGPDTVYLLTDADDLPAGSLATVQPKSGSGPGKGTVLHALEILPIGRSPGLGELQRLAESTNGSHRFLPLDALGQGPFTPPMGAFLNFRPGNGEEIGEP